MTRLPLSLHRLARAWLAPLALVAGLLWAGCDPGRSFLLKFSGPTGQNDPDVARVARVDLEIFDGKACTCLDLDMKAGCMTTDRIGSLAFSPSGGQRTEGGFPEGALVLRVSAYDAASAPIPLKIDCWCGGGTASPSGGVLTLPIAPPGTARVPAGAGCAN